MMIDEQNYDTNQKPDLPKILSSLSSIIFDMDNMLPRTLSPKNDDRLPNRQTILLPQLDPPQSNNDNRLPNRLTTTLPQLNPPYYQKNDRFLPWTESPFLPKLDHQRYPKNNRRLKKNNKLYSIESIGNQTITADDIMIQKFHHRIKKETTSINSTPLMAMVNSIPTATIYTTVPTNENRETLRESANQMISDSLQIREPQPKLRLKYIRKLLRSPYQLTITIEGNVGAGKTTLIEALDTIIPLKTVTLREPLEKWTNINGINLLQLAYDDPTKWATTFQSFVMSTMITNHLLPTNGKTKIMERSIFSARYCFNEHHKATGNINEVDFMILDQWFELITTRMHFPVDFTIYLQTSPNITMQRIQQRKRPEENNMDIATITNIHNLHENWLIKNQFPHTREIIILDGNQNPDSVLIQLNEALKHIHHHNKRMKIERHLKQLIPSHVGEYIKIDTFSIKDETYYTALDQYSRYVFLQVATEQQTEEIFLRIFGLFSNCQHCITHDEPIFTSPVVQNILKAGNIDHITIIGQSTSQTKTKTQQFYQALIELNEHLGNPRIEIQNILLNSIIDYNNTIHEVTNAKPIDVLFHQEDFPEIPNLLKKARDDIIEIETNLFQRN